MSNTSPDRLTPTAALIVTGALAVVSGRVSPAKLAVSTYGWLTAPGGRRRDENGFSVTTEMLALTTVVVLAIVVTFLPVLRNAITTVFNNAVKSITGAS